MFRYKTSCLAWWVASALFLASPAVAADPASGKTAVALYEEGVKLAEKKDYRGAEAKFLEAWSIQKSYDVAANLGEVQMQLDKPVDAIEYFLYAISNFPLGGKPQLREWVNGRLKDAKSKAFGITITVNVPGADVFVNGKSVGKAPVGGELFFAPGELRVTASAPDYEVWSKKVTGVAGGSEKVTVTLVQPQKSLVPGFAAGGVGLVALVAGLSLYVVSTDQYEQAKTLKMEIENSTPSHCRPIGAHPKCESLLRVAQSSDTLYGPSIPLLVGGSLLMVAGGAYLGYALKPPSGPKGGATAPRLTAVGARGAAVFVQGSF